MATSRFEVRCPSAVRDLFEVVKSIEGDVTYSQMFRRLLVNRARELAKGRWLTPGERSRLESLLGEISEAS